MSKQVAITATRRPGDGTGEARRLRSEGRIPAVAYGGGMASTPLSVHARELYHALHTEAGMNVLIRLDIDGEANLALAREIQRHPVRRETLHVDFVMIDRDTKVTVDIPIVLQGEAPGTEEGGVVDQDLFSLSVSVLPLEIPDQFVLDVGDMQVGDVKRVGDLDLPAAVESLIDPDTTVVSLNVPALEVPEPVEAEEEAEAAEAAEGVPTEGEAEAEEEAAGGSEE